MKKLLLAFAVFVLLSSLPAQSFQNTFSGTGNDMAYGMVSFSNHYLLGGSSVAQGRGKDIGMADASLLGTMLWGETIGGLRDDEAFAIIKTMDGGCLLAGYSRSFATTGTDSANAILVKTSSTGVVQWAKAYGGLNEDVFLSVVALPDSGFVACGYTKSFGAGGKDLLLARVDKNGNLSWMKAVGTAGDEEGNCITQTPTGQIVAAGSSSGFVAGNVVYMVKCDEAGTLAWAKAFDFTAQFNVRQRVAYGIYCTGQQYYLTGKSGMGPINDAQPFALCLDSSATMTYWANAYYLNSGDGEMRSIVPLNGGGFLLGGTMGNYHPAMVRLDANGTRLWGKYYSDANFTSQGRGYAALQASDGGMVLACKADMLASGDSSMLLIKTTANGDVTCNSNTVFLAGDGPLTISFCNGMSTETSGGVAFAVSLIDSYEMTETLICSDVSVQERSADDAAVYPNPFHDQLSITLPHPVQEATFTLYDPAGKVLRTANVSGLRIEFLRNDLAAGIYFWTIRDAKGAVFHGKVIAE